MPDSFKSRKGNGALINSKQIGTVSSENSLATIKLSLPLKYLFNSIIFNKRDMRHIKQMQYVNLVWILIQTNHDKRYLGDNWRNLHKIGII